MGRRCGLVRWYVFPSELELELEKGKGWANGEWEE